jgi:hypothetical protein
MARFSNYGLLAGLVVAGCLTGGIGAQDRPLAQEPGGGPARTAAGQVLNDSSLDALLRNLGYDPEVTKSASGKRIYYRLVTVEDAFRFVVDISLDQSCSRLWFSAPLPEVAVDKVPPSRLVKLLEANDDITPASFSYDKARQRFYLNLAVDNRDITAAIVRKELTSLLRVIERTAPLWQDLPQEAAQAAPAK